MLGATTARRRRCSGGRALGWSLRDGQPQLGPGPARPSTTAGYIGFGDLSGAKQSTDQTYLQDAAEHGAQILVGCFAERVLVEDGRAAGVEAHWSDPRPERARA